MTQHLPLRSSLSLSFPIYEMGTETLPCLAGFLCRYNEISSMKYALPHLIFVAPL